MLKLRPRVNGQTEATKWEEDDAQDQLAARLDAEPPPPEFVPDPIPVLPTIKKTEAKKQTINVKELLDNLMEAYTNPTVRMWVDGSELCFEQVDLQAKTKTTWRIGFSHVRESSVKLLK